MSRRPFTLILPYYENARMLAVQYRHIAGLPPEVREALHLIVVDDGSPDVAAMPPLYRTDMPGLEMPLDIGIATFQLFRIGVDIRWNWLAARNIGVHHAKTEWVLMTDIDHLVPEATCRRIQEKKLDERCTYRFSRVDAPDLTPYKPHPNSWLLTKERMSKIGGYDERFSGFYGTDGEFRDRVHINSKRVLMLDEVLIRYPREVVPDASTTRYGRKEQQDHDGVTLVRAKIARARGSKPVTLSFPYTQVS